MTTFKTRYGHPQSLPPPDNSLLISYKAKEASVFDTAAFYCPYIPLMMTTVNPWYDRDYAWL